MPGLALYVHWPYCARICPYCDFNIYRARGREEEALSLARAIVAEIHAAADALGPRSLTSVFFGGGTPSLAPIAFIEATLGAARGRFPVDAPPEVTLEANPTDADDDRFRALRQAGITRLSLGVQAFDDSSLAFLGRDHDAGQALRSIDLAQKRFDRVSIDLIYALPGQSRAAWVAELKKAAASGVEHVSPYQLAIEQGTAFDRAVRRGRFRPPGPDQEAELYEDAQAVLGEAGLEAYEVSNHARGQGARSVHNLHVWRGGDYLGVGPGAHGRVTLDGARRAQACARDPRDYVLRVARDGRSLVEDEPLTPVQAAEERLLLGLRLSTGARRSDLEALDGPDFSARLASLVDLGLIALEGDAIVATARGRPVLDSLAGRLLA